MSKKEEKSNVEDAEKVREEKVPKPKPTKPFTILGEVVFDGDGKVSHKETKVNH